MKSQTTLLFSVCMFIVLKSTQAFDCTGKTDGIYEASCHTYIQCTNGVATTVECRRPQVVNRVTGACDQPLNVNDPCGTYRECSGKDDGMYPDLEKNCQYYFVCSNGDFLGHNPCPPGLVLNSELQACDYKSNVKRPCGIKP